MIVWRKRIEHIDRPVKVFEFKGLRSRLRKEEVRKRRGLPSRSVSSAVAFESIDIKLCMYRGEVVDPIRIARLEWMRIRERMLERKRGMRRAARRRVWSCDTTINLWRRRRDWLVAVEAG